MGVRWEDTKSIKNIKFNFAPHSKYKELGSKINLINLFIFFMSVSLYNKYKKCNIFIYRI